MSEPPGGEQRKAARGFFGVGYAVTVGIFTLAGGRAAAVFGQAGLVRAEIDVIRQAVAIFVTGAGIRTASQASFAEGIWAKVRGIRDAIAIGV